MEATAFILTRSIAKAQARRQAAREASANVMTDTEIQAYSALVPQASTAMDAIQVAAVGLVVAVADMDAQTVVQVEAEAQAGHSLSRVLKRSNQVTQRMHRNLL